MAIISNQELINLLSQYPPHLDVFVSKEFDIDFNIREGSIHSMQCIYLVNEVDMVEVSHYYFED